MTTTKMDPNVKEQWLLALRSGEYQQVEGALARTVAEDQPEPEMGYCCLGVLCEIAVKSGVIGPAEISVDPTFGDESWVYGYEKVTDALPVEVRDWAGLDKCSPVIPRDPFPFFRSLADLNDLDGKSFAQIADLIEEHL